MASLESCPNTTNITILPSEEIHIDIVKCSVGVTLFLLVLPFVLFHFKRFPITATGAVLIGALITVLSQTISQHETYQVLGAPENVRTICLLLGMMIMAQYFERELLAERLLSKILRENASFSTYLFAVTAFDFVLAAVFTNDVACVALTPMILAHWNEKRRSKCRTELSVLLLGIATSANIGSASTIFGNPQMALVASKTSQPLFDRSRLDMRRCVFYLWIPAALCYAMNFGFLLVYARILKWIEMRKKRAHEHANGVGVKKDIANYAAVHPNQHYDQPINRLPIERTISAGSSVIAAQKDQPIQDQWTPSNSISFQIILCLGVLLIVVLFLISNERVHFDMGLIPMGVAILAISFDSLINKRPPMDVLKRVDWSVLLMFFGMFVWLYGLNKTHAPRYIWNRLNVAEIMTPTRNIISYLVFYAFIMICSNIFSNVPLTIIVLELLLPCIDQLELVLYLSWLSTIAGNLTLFGSVANLIVAQKAYASIGYRLGFFEYLQYGFLTTVVLSVVGMAVIFGLLKAW